MKKLLIKTKLLILIGVAILGLAIFGILSYNTMQRLKVNGPLYSQIIEGKDLVADILPPPEYIIESYLLTYEMFSTETKAEEESIIKSLNELEKNYYLRHQYWIDVLATGEMRKYMVESSYRPADEFFKTINNSFIPLIKEGDKSEALKIVEQKLRPLYKEHRQAIDKVVEMANSQNTRIENESKDEISSSYLFLGFLFFLIMAISLSFGYYIIVSVTKPLKKGVDFARDIANGNLVTEYISENEDEIGNLALSLTEMVENLRRIVASVVEGASHISISSQDFNDASQQLSGGASEQASSIEEVSASIEEMVAMIQQNMDNARKTEKITSSTYDEIINLAGFTQKIVESNRTVSEKIKIITDIAFQTNILALNAAVEAARAGEHGKGFSVVASEIRKLAERSKLAADEIIEATVSNMSLIEETNNRMDRVLPDIKESTDLVKQITISGIEQNNGAEQVNLAIQRLNSVTQQNAASSEKLAANAEELAAHADQLNEMVAHFKVK